MCFLEDFCIDVSKLVDGDDNVEEIYVVCRLCRDPVQFTSVVHNVL